ncbi:conserved hypothetical protein [Candida dubliniensis CD36]|uniref:Uncharacterized protein n=1 Tax=Candida dubliniensis (strain CD36 / ATCC MYA-646 / CBS 7987 / NCPF 3949 / NRRL Y-17841) TaxID=573826 RepID=B9WHV6_CANDC|nr:conserved hypothetical protein [Candida dubliniensis CD36]CAX41750.1 conserved hypothetical protein [Candida dubliniensis CD36]
MKQHNNRFKDLKKSKSLNFINSIVESKRIINDCSEKNSINTNSTTTNNNICITNNTNITTDNDDDLVKKFSLTRTINHENDSIDSSISKEFNNLNTTIKNDNSNWIRNFIQSNNNNNNNNNNNKDNPNSFYSFNHELKNVVSVTPTSSSFSSSSSLSFSSLNFSFYGDSIHDFTVKHKHSMTTTTKQQQQHQQNTYFTQKYNNNFFNINKKRNDNRNFKNKFYNWLSIFNHQNVIDYDNDTIYYNTCGSSIYS